MTTNQQATQNTNVIAGSIVFAGIIIALAILFGGRSGESATTQAQNQDQNNNAEDSGEIAGASDFRFPNEDDHRLGPDDAKVTIVEFSDFQCPFCLRLHPTLERVIEENDDVAWAYRHLPLPSHPDARPAAIASECIASLAGNDAFWTAAEAILNNQRGLGETFYQELASDAGIESEVFAACLDSSEIAAEVKADEREAARVGGSGTPFNVVVTASGKLMPFAGALPFEQIQSIVDQARTN